jgi:hypothetical protein
MAYDAILATKEANERIGRALFEYQESILPEGETWEELDDGDQSFWIESAKRVIWAWEQFFTE